MDLPHRLFKEREVDRLYRDLLVVDAGGTVDFGVPGTIVPDDAAAEGAAATAARSDHTHAIATAVAGAATPGAAAAEGAATSFARSDHGHSLPAFGTVAGTFAEGNDSRFSNIRKIWDGRVVPSGLHADSDEFDDGAVAGAWTDFDPGSLCVTTEESPANALINTFTSTATFSCAGKYKAIPSNEFQFTAYVAHDSDMHGTGSTNAAFVGLALFNDATNSSAAILTNELLINDPDTSNLGLISLRSWSAYNASVSSFTRNAPSQNGVWLKFLVSISGAVTTYRALWSVDGVFWAQIHTGGNTLGYAAQHYGLLTGGNVNTIVFRTAHKHFRTVSGAGSSGYNFFRNGGYLGT